MHRRHSALETLERRTLLSIAAYQAIHYTGDVKTGAFANVGASLADAYTQYQTYAAPGGHQTGEYFRAANSVLRLSKNSILVEAVSQSGKGASLASALKNLGATSLFRSGNNLSALV
ncbi:MAG: hypothetical protein ACREJC_17155, partial [Tepidisphaeraceae bacterium]